MGRVVRLLDGEEGGSGGGGIVTTYIGGTYAILVSLYPSPPEGSLGIVLNATGVWPVNRRLAGVYIFKGGVWEYANEELQNRFLNSQWLFKVDEFDVLGGTLRDKVVDGNDTSLTIINDGQGVKSAEVKLRQSRKVYEFAAAPTQNDDDSTPFRHSIGQIWYDTANQDFYIAESLITGQAVWRNLFDQSPVLPQVVYNLSSDFSRPNQTTEGLISQGANIFETYLELSFTPLRVNNFEISSDCIWSLNQANADITIRLTVIDDTSGLIVKTIETVQRATNVDGTGVLLDVIAGGVVSGQQEDSGTAKRRSNYLRVIPPLFAGNPYTAKLEFTANATNVEASMYSATLIAQEIITS